MPSSLLRDPSLPLRPFAVAVAAAALSLGSWGCAGPPVAGDATARDAVAGGAAGAAAPVSDRTAGRNDVRAAATPAETQRTRQPSQPPPSFILIDVDTLRADRLSSYGGPRPTSPNIDAVAAEGTRFEWAFAQAPTTPPSQTSILTSLYPSSHGVEDRHDRVPREVETLAEVLKAEGYATAAFVDGGYMHHGFGLDQGFDLYQDEPGGLERIGPRALAWMRRHADRPFLLLVHTYDVHSPYLPPEPYRSLFADELPERPTPGFEPDQETLSTLRRRSWRESGPLLPARDLAYTVALYDAGIRYVDDWVGELRREMAELGLDRTAVLAIFSDHGEEFFEHGSVLHDKLYATTARVPLVIRRAGGGTGHVVEGPVEMIDLMPTLLDLAAVPVPAAAQGRSLAPWLDAGEPPFRPAFSESRMWKGQRAVTGETHRAVHWIRGVRGEGARSELYAYREDPLEQRDLSRSERDQLDDLHVDLRGWKRRVEAAPPPSDEGTSVPDEVLARLRALGYN